MTSAVTLSSLDDKVLDELNENELGELASLLSDLEAGSSSIPASERNTYHNEKSPTDAFDRTHLLNFLDKQAASVQPQEHYEPYTGEKKGKPYRPKKEVRKYDMRATGDVTDKIPIAEEWELLIDGANDEDLTDLAALLGFGNMVNQEQYQAAQKVLAEDKRNRSEDKVDNSFNETVNLKNTGLMETLTPNIVKSVAAKLTLPAKVGSEVNTVDVDDVIKQVMSNNASLTEVNFNNINGISKERFMNLFNALRQNRAIKKLLLANTHMEDCIAFALADCLEENDTITTLNVESNFLTGDGGLLRLCDAIEKNTTLREFRLSNQFTSAGQATEMRMADMLKFNKTLLKFGYNFDTAGPRNIATNALQRNVELNRRIKRGEVDDTSRAPEDRTKDERYLLQLKRKREQMENIMKKLIEAEQREQQRLEEERGKKEPLRGVVPRWERLGIADPRIPVTGDLSEDLSGLHDEEGETEEPTETHGLEDTITGLEESVEPEEEDENDEGSDDESGSDDDDDDEEDQGYM